MGMAVTYTNFCSRIVAENRNRVQKSYVRDTLGSTIELLDITQMVTDSWDYWPFGEVTSRIGNTPTPFGFGGSAGYYTISSLLIYIRARILGAAIGRWQTADPLWPMQDPYEYVSNQPSAVLDPSGLLGVIDNIVAGAIACAISGLASLCVCVAGGDSALVCGCKSGVSCLVTGIAGALSAQFPPLVKCLLGAGVSLASALAQILCKPSHDPIPWQCALGMALLSAIIGCIVGGIDGAEQVILRIISSVYGTAMGSICKSIWKEKNHIPR